MKKLIILLFSILAFCSLPIFAYADANSNAVSTELSTSKGVPVLFVLLSKKASIHAGKQAGTFVLTLNGVKSEVIYFSDRPARITGHLAIEKLLRQWESNGDFNKEPPNAVMEAIGTTTDASKKVEEEIRTHAIVLKNPTYRKDTQTLSFEISGMQGAKPLPNTATSNYVAIFIDSLCLTCLGG